MVMIDKSRAKQLKSAAFLTTAVAKDPQLISKLMDLDTLDQQYQLMKTVGFADSFDAFKADLASLAAMGKGTGLDPSIEAFAADCGCPAYS